AGYKRAVLIRVHLMACLLNGTGPYKGALARDDGGIGACPGSRPMNLLRADAHRTLPRIASLARQNAMN
ncbi:hypothetical protein, partial [Halomonas sp. 141]|uniref:hypothetical protein n=1 Tax=Halomonas sp. 141 TaxID=2056666 RepID=UPI001E36E5D8